MTTRCRPERARRTDRQQQARRRRRRAPRAHPLAHAADAPPRGGRRRRPRRHHPDLRAPARRQRALFAPGRDDLPHAVGGARHHRHRRGAADHRRRVRSLGRLDDRLRRHRHRSDRSLPRLPALGRHPLGLRRGGAGRLLQRPDRRPHAAALLHRHARLALHPARPLDRRHPRRHRPHPDSLHPRRHPRSGHRRDLQRPRPHRPLPLDGRAGLDRHPQRRRAVRAGRADVDRLVARRDRGRQLRRSPRSASATGSTPPAATPTSRATSACRWRG